jgi:hypothetical protein
MRGNSMANGNSTHAGGSLNNGPGGPTDRLGVLDLLRWWDAYVGNADPR